MTASTPDQQHLLVEKLVHDVAEPPRLALLAGFAGESSLPGYRRLYLDDELRMWIELPGKAVRYSDFLPPSTAAPWGVSVLWVEFPEDAEKYPLLLGGELEGRI